MRVDKYLEEQKIDVQNYSFSEINQMIAFHKRKIDEFVGLLNSEKEPKIDLFRLKTPRKTKAKQGHEKYVE